MVWSQMVISILGIGEGWVLSQVRFSYTMHTVIVRSEQKIFVLRKLIKLVSFLLQEQQRFLWQQQLAWELGFGIGKG